MFWEHLSWGHSRASVPWGQLILATLQWQQLAKELSMLALVLH